MPPLKVIQYIHKYIFLIIKNKFTLLINKKMEDYIKKYKKALKDPSIPANKILCNSSCLQYFHAELGIK